MKSKCTQTEAIANKICDHHTSRNISEIRQFNEAIENSCRVLLRDATTTAERLFAGRGDSRTNNSDKAVRDRVSAWRAVTYPNKAFSFSSSIIAKIFDYIPNVSQRAYVQSSTRAIKSSV